MGAPKYMLQCFYDGLIQQQSPADHACEQRVIAAIFGNKDATGAASGFLVPDDFDDAQARATFERTIGAYKEVGGGPVPLQRDTQFGLDCLRLRELLVKRYIESLGWELVYTAIKGANAAKWCSQALQKIQALAERIRETGGAE